MEASHPQTKLMRPPFIAVALISATALAYELLLLRLFAFAQWDHLAYMVISLALLGYGVSGSFVAVAQRQLLAHVDVAFILNCCLFGVSAVACALIAQHIPFNPEQVLWDLRHPQRLLLIYLLLMLPFFFAANAIALSLACFRTRIPRLYAADLAGAGVGSVALIGLLNLAFPVQVLGLLGACALLAATIAVWELRPARGALWTCVTLGTGSALWLLSTQFSLSMSPYKPLSQLLRIPETRISSERSSPLGVLTAVESPQIPLREAPGLSLAATSEPPPQVAVFTDGDAMTVITDGNQPRSAYDYLDQVSSALPYHLAQPQSALVLGAGGGSEVLQAWAQAVPDITAVERNPQLAALLREEYAAFSGHLYDRPGIALHIADARGFIASDAHQYDLIQIAFLDSQGAASAGLRALREDYLYTIESFSQLLAHLAPDGWLALTRWIDLPPRDLLKLALTAATALERTGATDPGAQLIMIRGWQTGTLLVKKGVITADELDKTRRFCTERSFDLAWAPGLAAAEANRYNKLAKPYYFEAMQAILGLERNPFLARYKFDLQPAYDDRPYFYHFARLSTLPELLQLRSQGGMPLIEWGYLVMLATLAQAVLASALLILLPLRLLRRRVHHDGNGAARGPLPRVVIYFTAVGLAFLFIEIACMQRFTLLLHHPVYAAATVLTGFLLFAGLGSAYAEHLARRGRHRQGIRAAVALIACIILIYLQSLGPLFEILLTQPLWVRTAASLLLIMPLAFAMGLPFPLGLARLAELSTPLIPWAWGVNGCASVISAVLATLLAVHFGFNIVLLCAVGLYLLAALSVPGEHHTTR